MDFTGSGTSCQRDSQAYELRCPLQVSLVRNRFVSFHSPGPCIFPNGHLWLQGSLDAMVHLRWLKRHLTSRFSSDAPPMTPKMQGPHKSAVGWKSKLLCLSPWPSRTQQAALLGSPTTAFPGPVSKIPANDRLPRTKHRKDVPFAAGIYATCVCKTKRKKKKNNKRNRHQYVSTHSAPRAGAARAKDRRVESFAAMV